MGFRPITAWLAVLVPLTAFATAPLIPEPVPAAERLFAKPLPETLDGRLAFAYRVGRSEATDESGAHHLLGRSVSPHGVRVTLRFTREVDEALAAAVSEAGCVLARLPDGALAPVGSIVEADCRWDSLALLALRKDVARVAPTFGFRPLPPQAAPQNTTAVDVEAVQLRQRLHPLGRGEGVVVADVDSGFDPFHPVFFRADGGAYRWLDVNGSGAFEPLVDAVDFNANGTADQDEKLGVIKAMVVWFYGQPGTYNAAGDFVPGVDWLYQDENGDGQRNQGPNAPYGDQKPTFGEQLYVADDVNKNGLLEPDEKLIRLHTPKVKAALFSPVQGGATRVYRRGVDLSQFPIEYDGQEMHGTMVMGTIAGNDPRYMRYAGIAPDAELLLGTSSTENLVTVLSWARSEGAQIVLWEMATWYMEHLDGSSALELACDTASDQGVLQVGAAGNLGGSQKHRVKSLNTGATEQVPLVVPGGMTSYVLGNFNWRGTTSQLQLSLTLGGQTVQLTTAGGQTTVGTTTVYWQTAPSSRGTQMTIFYLLPPQGQTLAGQTAQFTVSNSGAPVELHGFVTDSYSSWGMGVHWPLTTGATDRGTYGTPGVGDKTLAIGTSFLDFVPTGEVSGALARHSGQGPRLDGLDTIDIVAPEDHITGISWKGQVPFGAMMVGGGTSNASPVAVGAMALLKGLRPSATPVEIRDLVRNFAQVEAQMGQVPNDLWGYGKLRVFRAQHAGALPVTSMAPEAGGTAVRGQGGLVLDASASSDPENEALRFFWDVDYDGTFELGPLDAPTQTVALPPDGATHVRLEVLDPHGFSATALIAITGAQSSTDGGVDLPDAGTPDAGTGSGGAPRSYLVLNGPDSRLGPSAGGCSAVGGAAFPATLALLALAARAARRRR